MTRERAFLILRMMVLAANDEEKLPKDNVIIQYGGRHGIKRSEIRKVRTMMVKDILG